MSKWYDLRIISWMFKLWYLCSEGRRRMEIKGSFFVVFPHDWLEVFIIDRSTRSSRENRECVFRAFVIAIPEYTKNISCLCKCLFENHSSFFIINLLIFRKSSKTKTAPIVSYASEEKSFSYYLIRSVFSVYLVTLECGFNERFIMQ